MSSRTTWTIAGITATLVAAIRFYYESSMPKLVPYDAQAGIWVTVSIVMSTATFLICLGLTYGALRSRARKKHLTAMTLSIGIIAVMVYTAMTLIRYHGIRVALSDSANPNTRPERLHQLIGFETGFGYEIDNRIASNPNSTEDTLRTLSKKDQLGTMMSLAQNPNTPDDILESLSRNPDEWIQQSLERNPKHR